MEATDVFKLLFGLLIAWSVLYVLLLRPWRPARLIRNGVPSVDLLFVAGVLVGTLATLEPLPFHQGARLVVQHTELPETLAGIDARIEAVEQLPERTWQRFMSRLGWIEEDLAAPDVGPSESGRVTSTVLPAVVALVEMLLRTIALWGALIVMAVAQVMRLAVGLRRWHRERAQRGREKAPLSLDARVMALEEAVVTLRLAARLEGPSSEPAEA